MIGAPALSRRILLAAPLALLTGRSAAGAAPKVVTILGDSITAGLGLPASQALPAQLHLALNRLGVANIVRGAGVSGDTTAGGAARVDFSIRQDTAAAVVALGGNDLLQGIDPRLMRANLEKILNRLARRRIAVVLVGLKAPPEIGASYARDFDAVFSGLARSHRLAFYPDLLAGVARNPALKQADGLHPNAAGARVIAAGLAPVVARALKR
jgi:acyl-CoA thioesterase-1